MFDKMTATLERPAGGEIRLTDLTEFERQFGGGGGNGGNNGNDRGGEGGRRWGNDDEEPIEGADLVLSVGGMIGGIILGVMGVDRYGHYGIDRQYVGYVPTQREVQNADFSTHAELAEISILVGPIVTLAALGYVIGKKLDNFANRR